MFWVMAKCLNIVHDWLAAYGWMHTIADDMAVCKEKVDRNWVKDLQCSMD